MSSEPKAAVSLVERPNRSPQAEGDTVATLKTRMMPSVPAADGWPVGGLPAAPQSRNRMFRRVRRFLTVTLFLLVVAAPTAGTLLYTGWWASKQYTSEFQFAIRGWDAPVIDQVGGLLGGPSAGGLVLANSYIVTEYLRSRDAIEAIKPSIDVISVFSNPEIDWLARYRGARSADSFLPFWRSRLKTNFDPLTGIITGAVEAHDPVKAQEIAKELRSAAERLINKLSEGARFDAVRLTQVEVERAEQKLRAARLAMQKFRNQNRLIDPQKEIEGALLTLRDLKERRGNAQAEIEAQDSVVGKNAPAIQGQRARLKALDEQIKQIEDKLASNGAQASSLSTLLPLYQELDVQQNLAERGYTISVEALERARRDADRKQIYLATFVEARLPEAPSFPNPVKNVLIVFSIVFCGWIVLTVFLHSLLDRARAA